jgi:hypothetical protein
MPNALEDVEIQPRPATGHTEPEPAASDRIEQRRLFGKRD